MVSFPYQAFTGTLACRFALLTPSSVVSTDPTPKPTLFAHEFALADRVALVSGANGGLGLEMALAVVEAGARAVYCVDLPREPSAEWKKVQAYASKLAKETGFGGEGRLEYASADVTDQVRALPGEGMQPFLVFARLGCRKCDTTLSFAQSAFP